VLGKDLPLYEYTVGTWGPAEAERLITAGPCMWHNPGADAHAWTRACNPRPHLRQYAP
jgi:hypothetical protein